MKIITMEETKAYMKSQYRTRDYRAVKQINEEIKRQAIMRNNSIYIEVGFKETIPTVKELYEKEGYQVKIRELSLPDSYIVEISW